ncbi:MAG: MFS transporter, partial [Promethearchaeota archaeon]
EINDTLEVPEIHHSKKIMISYSFGMVVTEFIGTVIIMVLFIYYETEIGLSSLLTGLGLAIFAIWDAFNDTIVGYISDRPYRFTKKWGRRFPWIIGAFIPMLICFLLIFNPPKVDPQENPWIIFMWLVITTCLFDTFESMAFMNFFSLFPDKFRSDSERLKVAGFGAYFGFFGILLGMLIPPMIIVFGRSETYFLMAILVVVICLVFWVISIPGVRDDKEVVECFLAKCEETESSSVFKDLSNVLKQKNLRTYMFVYFLFFVLMSTMGASFFYYVRYVLKADASLIVLIMGLYFLGVLVATPLWLIYVKKRRDKKQVMILGGVIMVITAILITFVPNFEFLLIIVFIHGMGLGGFSLMINPVFGDIIDESVIQTEKRREGLLGGLRFFVTNLARVVQALILAFVHELTGFKEGSDTQPASAIFGIQLHIGLIPAIFLLIGLLTFWKLYDITPNKLEQNKLKLKQLGF